jgi:hypothetical protein
MLDFYEILLSGRDPANRQCPLRSGPTNLISRSQLRPEGGSPTRLTSNGQGIPLDDVAGCAGTDRAVPVANSVTCRYGGRWPFAIMH